MANDYFDEGDYQGIQPHTLARGSQINSIASAVINGFNKLPAPDALREDRVTYIEIEGGPAEYTGTLTGLEAYAAGMTIKVKPAMSNTGAATLNLNGLGAVAVKTIEGSDLSANDLPADAVIPITYNGVEFRLAGSSISGVATAVSAASAASNSANQAASSALAAANSAIAAANSANQASNSASTAAATLAASALKANNLSDLTSDDAAIANLVGGATVTTSPANADKIPLRTSGGDGRAVSVADLLAAVPLRGYLSGLTISRNATVTSLDIAAGVARDDGNADFMNLASAITKSLNANWAVGTGEGGLDTGSKANSTWYHVFLIKRVDTGVVDALFSLSAASPTMPANYTLKRRIGSILTDSSGDIVAFSQNGDEFLWSAAVGDVNASSPGTSAVTRALTVPSGLSVWAKCIIGVTNTNNANTCFARVSALDTDDEAPNVGTSQIPQAGALAGAVTHSYVEIPPVRTNTSGQVRSRVSLSNANVTFRITTLGWIDRRGRDD